MNKSRADAPLRGVLGSWALPPKAILFAIVLVAVAATVLGACAALIGPYTATSGYLTILFLLSIVRGQSWRARGIAVAWSFAVAMLGFALGGLGMPSVLAALVVVSLVQGMTRLGETAMLTRSPVNLLAFASLSESGAQMWQLLLGSAIGAGVVLGLAALSKQREADHGAVTSARERLAYGIATAVGAVVIVWGSEALGFGYAGWALLSFCILLSASADQRVTRGSLRILGSVGGALLAVGIAMFPAPVPMLAALVSLVLCVAYINTGNYGLFMLFLTPAILLTTASEVSLARLGVFRLEATLVATGLALFGAMSIEFALRRWAAGGRGAGSRGPGVGAGSGEPGAGSRRRESEREA